ncbi:MAG: FAD-dependent oxidoreductase [Smithellaceae bacterium]|nr:FAD-dependent oxidoreductase [Smithellaceae bacterium]
MTHDVIVCGAGPAGLAAAISSARSGLKILLVERGYRPGPEPRGETARPHEVFEELLGTGFMEKISLHRTAARRIVSPGAKKAFEIERKHSSYIFDWFAFIDRLWEVAKEEGVEFRFACTVAEAIVEDGVCVGVRTAAGEELRARTVIDACGHNSLLGRALGIDYNRLTNPMIKAIISNFSGTYRGLELFFIPRGTLSFAPDFPPAIAYIFPRDPGNCEIGLMIMSGPAKKIGASIPSGAEQLRVWQEIKASYPGFSARIKGAKIDYEGLTGLTMAGLQEESMLTPGLLHLGDAIGFVEASGGCGLASSLQNGLFAAGFIASEPQRPWDKGRMAAYNDVFGKTEIFRHIRKVYGIVVPVMGFIFSGLKTPARINRYWWLAHLFYKLG